MSVIAHTKPAESETSQAASGRKRRDASRREILAATERLLAGGQSVARLTVDRIVEEAGVSRATFYVCFVDKHEVVGRLAEEVLRWRWHAHTEVLADEQLTHERLDELLGVAVDGLRASRPVLSAIIELAEHDPAIRETWKNVVGEIAHQSAEQLHLRWRKIGRPTRDAYATATALAWMVERCCHQVVVDDDSAKTVAQALSDILWRTLTYDDPPAPD